MKNIKYSNFRNLLILAFLFASVFLSYNISAQQHIYPPQKVAWNPDSLGNHRAVVMVKDNEPKITISIDWRNRNVRPNQKVYVVDSTTNQLVTNVDEKIMHPEKGVIAFDATSGKGIYYVYYLPYHLGGRSRNYPDAIYKTTDKLRGKAIDEGELILSKKATVIRLESVDEFNSNDPMEIIATREEVEEMKNKYRNKEYLVFPEARENPIKMQDYLPHRWINESSQTIVGKSKRGEFFTFQLGIWPLEKDIENVNVNFSELSDGNGSKIPSGLITCFNTVGVDYAGNPMYNRVDVKNGEIQALWFGLHVPENIPPGSYKGFATIKPGNAEVTQIAIELTITREVALIGDIDKPWNQTRLHWLNSTLAQENTVIAPYTNLRIDGNTISLLGRKVVLADDGFPEQIISLFTEEMTGISSEEKNILSGPFHFDIVKDNGEKVPLSNSGVLFNKKESGIVTWHSKGNSEEINIEVEGSLEFDGFVNYEVKVIANQNLNLKDIALKIPINAHSSRYILGLGNIGGFRPGEVDWKWDVKNKNQDGMWLGDVNAGLQLTLKDENYQRPLNTNFYLQKPLISPGSWANEKNGGIRITENNSVVEVNNYSGERTMKKGDTLYYNFTLLITPFHTLQTDDQWNERYYHSFKPIDSVIQSGSNVINIHHGNILNPYINYPFIATEEMKSYVESAHQAGLKVKIYNTVREVSNRMYELYPLRSLGHEIFSPGPGKGYSWLQEHVHNDYIAAWYVPQFKDAALINSGMSRWHNYYVEGMNWLVDNIGIDGIYLDDVAFDRITMKRIKRVLTKNGHAGLIDLHSANQYNTKDGFNNSANLYMEHFPYINRLWFGEYFNYEEGTPDFYMTEVSGIPFGLMGEMLQDGGNQWRGMVYGMTNRMPYQKQRPDQIWKAWDSFGMEGSRMIGYWVENRPVKTNHQNVLATTYQKNNKVLVAIASWAPSDTYIKLDIDWEKLGINPKTAKITAPEIKDYQHEAIYKVTDEIFVEKNKGWLLIIE